MELKTAKAKFTIGVGKELQSEIIIDGSDSEVEKDFLKMENKALKCELDRMKYELEKEKNKKASEYQICLKDDITITAKVEEGDSAGCTWDGLIAYGKVVVKIDEFKYAVPIKCDNE